VRRVRAHLASSSGILTLSHYAEVVFSEPGRCWRMIQTAGAGSPDPCSEPVAWVGNFLLASWEKTNLLVEVKSSTGNPPESLAEAPSRQMKMRAQLRPDIPVSQVALVLNHQSKTFPAERSTEPCAGLLGNS
jgi:hypothetical protein